VESLPEKCREIFILGREERLSYKEIAQVKEISVKTVENQMGIALKKIREYITSRANESMLSILLSLNLFE
ncbi:sigma factor-like helix-turn-helix DNA-binding protein, partial [Parabacteroides leei]